MDNLVIFGALLLVVVFVLGCTDNIQPKTYTNPEDCNSLCDVNKTAFCEEARIININGTDVVGTCRAFSRKENVLGFNRCEKFCREFDKSGITCSIDGQLDSNCDGLI